MAFDSDIGASRQFFGPMLPQIRAFAERVNLKLEEYPKQQPAIYLNFRHPAGGVGSIAILRSGASTIRVSTLWHIDDVATLRRRVWFGEGEEFERDDPKLIAVLETHLASLCHSSSNILKPVSQPYPEWRGREKMILNDPLRYPLSDLSTLTSSR